MNNRIFLQVVCIAVGLMISLSGRAATPEKFVSCFEADAVDAMQYVTPGVAKKIFQVEASRDYSALRVTMKLDRMGDGRVANPVFLKKSSIAELNDISAQIAMASIIRCPNAPMTSQIVDVLRWSMHLASDEKNGEIKGVPLVDRMISNFRQNPHVSAEGQKCVAVRDEKGVATSYDCSIEGMCLPAERVHPEFPSSEYQRGIFGRTRVEGRVGENGSAVFHTVTHSAGNRNLDDAAVKAFKRMKFKCSGPNPDRDVSVTFDFAKPDKRFEAPISRRRNY